MAEAEGKLQNLFLITSNYNEVDELLAKWLVEQFLLVTKRIISINFKINLNYLRYYGEQFVVT